MTTWLILLAADLFSNDVDMPVWLHSLFIIGMAIPALSEIRKKI